MKISGHILKIAEPQIVKVFPEMEVVFAGTENFEKIAEAFEKLIPAPERDIESLGFYFDAEILVFMAGRELKEIRFVYPEILICKYAKYTDKPFTGCSTCGGVIVECQNEKKWPKKRNSKTCNSTCELFAPAST